MAKNKTSKLAEIYRAEKKRGGGLTSTLAKATLEKIDPRQFFNQKGLLAEILPSFFKAYTAPTANKLSPVKVEEDVKPTLSFSKLENKIDVLINETSELKTHAKISAKNSLVLPYISRDMNVTRLNIQKLVKLMGGKATQGSDAFFKRASERESLYESQFKRESKKPTTVTPIVQQKPTEEGSNKSLLGGLAAGAGAALGGVIAGAGSIGGGALSGLGSVLGGVISALGAVTASIISLIPAIIGLTTTILSSAGAKIVDLAKVLLTPANLTLLAGAVVTAIFAYGISKLLENMKEGEKQKDELSKIREKEKLGQKLTEEEAARKKELETKGVTATTGEASRIATKSSMTLGTAQALLSSGLNEQEIKEQSGVSRRVLQEYVKRGGKTDTFTLSREMGEEPSGNFTAETTARMTGDKGSMRGPQGQKLVIQNGVRGYYDTSSGARVFTPLPQAPLDETTAETARLRSQPIRGVPSSSTTPTAAEFQKTDKVTRTVTSPKPGEYGQEQRFPPQPEPSESLIQFIKKKEGFSSKATWDYQQYSNGYGTKANSPNEVIDEKEADARARKHISEVYKGVLDYTEKNGYKFNQNQIEALTSFSYNFGLGRLNQLTDNGKRDAEEISKKMVEYVNVRKKNKETGVEQLVPEPGLITRRTEEQALFNTPVNVVSLDTSQTRSMTPVAAAPAITPVAAAPAITPVAAAPAITPVAAAPAITPVAAAPKIPQNIQTVVKSDGNRLGSATIEVSQAKIQIGSAPIVVPAPAVNVQAPQVQASTNYAQSSSVVDSEFMKLLVGRTVSV